MVSRETLGAEHFFSLEEVWFSDFFQEAEFPWELLASKRKEAWIQNRMKANVEGVSRSEDGFVTETQRVKCLKGEAWVRSGSYLVGNDIELREGVEIEPGAYVTGPTILGPKTTVRHGAYIRGGVITGRGAVIGHATEVKSSIFLNEAKAAHFAYVGDSILGNGVNLGAGTKVSNLKMTNDEVVLRIQDSVIHTGLRKMGAIIGDRVETGCNSVLNPGVLLAPECMVYPAVAVRKKYYKAKSRIR